MNDQPIIIRQGTIKEVVELSRAIPEFHDPYKEEDYYERLNDKQHLILVADVHGELAGFKVGYDKFGDRSFYTWMGGVLPAFRKQGVAKMLAEYQEEYAKNAGFKSILLKTRNRHKNMLLFAISSGFKIVEVECREPIEENRILLRKLL